MEETLDLLNSEEYKVIAEGAGIDIPVRTESNIADLFHKVDKDRSGSLDRIEFIMFWLSLAFNHCKANPKMVANAFCMFVDEDGDGKVQAKEVKRFLPLLGPMGLAMLAVPVPDWVELDYAKYIGSYDE
eukprot:CAMPEP_0196593710 /NCGR_PEP_ID=MMETSP1081-20130531/76351_1 /TAXON_ID=36882 /ORGANISM="Pyramimonas amylifera, Strain CCMP720" /LENGTH=128 /DNA_ID=CAMNT_0041917771 /DNA_START=422 /DNA_END=808 /DNA_ORIENTATION=+